MKAVRFCIAATIAVSGWLSGYGAEPAPSLKESFSGLFRIGVALSDRQFSETDRAQSDLVKRQFNSITPEDDLKWEFVHPEAARYNFVPADRYVHFGERNGMFIIGHTLVWHLRTPRWVFRDQNDRLVSRDVLIPRMTEHIKSVVGRYKGRIHGWDVVNEALEENGSLRQSWWAAIIGPEYIELAFRAAHEADPATELYYNDFGLEKPAKRLGAIKLIAELRSKGIPVAAVGLQGHYSMDFPTAGALRETIEEFARHGIKAMITELDLNMLPPTPWLWAGEPALDVRSRPDLNPYRDGLPPEVAEKIAARYVELFDVLLAQKANISRVTFWNLTDGDSWLNYFPVAGRTAYPLLFDRQGNPNEAFRAVLRLLQKRNVDWSPKNAGADWGRPLTLSVGAEGVGALAYQWFKDGQSIAGATGDSYTIAAAAAGDAGTYTVRVTRDSGTVESTGTVVTVHAEAARLTNLSTRGHVGPGERALISGCVAVGSGATPTLFRAIGPTLANFNIDASQLLADPRVSVRDLNGVEVAANDDWSMQGNPAAVLAAFSSAGAFPLPAGSLDAALFLDVPPNRPVTTVVRGAPERGPGGTDGSGVAIVEAYALEDLPGRRLVNLSTRGFVGTGSTSMILGFSLGSGGTRRLLIRGVGPTLGRMAPGLQPLLLDPVIVVRTTRDGSEIARNDNWEAGGRGPEIGAMGARVGAFPLDAASLDAGLILEVPPAVPGGNDRAFTVQVFDGSTRTGMALLEVYEVPTT